MGNKYRVCWMNGSQSEAEFDTDSLWVALYKLLAPWVVVEGTYWKKLEVRSI